jgi:hypothetical protein
MEEQQMTMKEAIEIARDPKKYVKYFEDAKDFCFNKKLHDALRKLTEYAEPATLISEDTRAGTVYFRIPPVCYDEYVTDKKIFITEHGDPNKILLSADKAFYRVNMEGEE